MTSKLVVAAAAAVLGIAAYTGDVRAQEAAERERAMEDARAALEQARRELEAAAREVARLSAGSAGPFLAAGAFGSRAALGVNLARDGAPNGARVLGVTPGGAAAEAGVMAGDVITAVDGIELAGGERSASDRLVEHMAGVEPGQNVALRILRGDDAREITVEAAEQNFMFSMRGPRAGAIGVVPATPGIRVTPAIPMTREPNVVWSGVGPNIARFERVLGTRWNDIELVPLTEELGRYFGTDEGLLVVRAPADDEIGLRDGDVILEIGGRAPATPEHAMRILMSFEAGETLRLSIMRRERRQVIEYTIPGESRPG